MNYRFVWLLILFISLLRAGARAGEGDANGDRIARLRRDFPVAIAIVEDRYKFSGVVFDYQDMTDWDLIPEAVKTKRKAPPGVTPLRGVLPIEKAEVEFVSAGKFQKCTVISTQGDDLHAETEQQSHPYKRVFSIGPRGCFTLTWATISAHPELNEFTMSGGKSTSSLHNYVSIIQSAYSLPFGRFAALIDDKNFHLSKVDDINFDGRHCLRAEFDYRRDAPANTPPGKRPTTSVVGSFVVDPELGWAVRSWEYSTPGSSRSIAARISYRKGDDGVITPSEITQTSDKARIRVCSIRQFKLSRVADSEFTLTSYGMPELDRPIGDLSHNSMPYWLAGAAALSIMISAVLWYRSLNPRRSAEKGQP